MRTAALKTIFVLLVGTVLFITGCESQNNSSENTISADGLFAGKTIEYIIPFKEGGGSDTWARFNAPFLSRYLPGNPVVIVSNVPGGGSIKGANLFAERASNDGLMIFGTSGSTQMPYLLDDPRVKYEYKNFKVLMAYPNGGVVYCSPKLGINNAFEMKNLGDKQLIYASQGPTSLDIVPMLAFDLLGLNVKTVFGFRGRGAGRLAYERGEVAIDYQTSSAYLKNVLPLVQEGSAVPLWSWGILDDEGNLTRDPSFPDLPHFGEVYEALIGKEQSGIAWNSWFALMSAGFGGMKLLLVPKETPDNIVQAYQKAFLEMRNDEEYIAKKQKAIGLYVQEVGDKAKVIFDLSTNISQDEKNWVKNWLREKYDLNIK